MNKTAKIISACSICALAVGLGVFAFSLKDTETVPTFSSVIEPETTVIETTAEPTTLPVYDYVPTETGMTERAKMLLKQNKDIIGWIKIENTDVDYPVVLDPGEIPANSGYGSEEYGSNEYYLSHDLDGSYKRAGTLFMDYRDVFGSNESEQSENIVIYGHNMANNTMFGSIRRYRQDYSFYDVSPFIEMSSNYKDYDYVIFGFLITSGNWYTDFDYWNREELDTQEDFDFYINNVRRGQMIDTGVDVQYGDKLLTLSTCYADEDNSRFIIVARRLRDGEVAGDMSTIRRTEEYIKAHSPIEETSEESQN